jgi:hypothetical protein
MAARTAPTIALGPTCNQRGGHYFLSLRHGRVLRRTRWDELPMPQDVIDRVSAIGHLQGMPQILTFSDAYGRELSDTDFDVDCRTYGRTTHGQAGELVTRFLPVQPNVKRSLISWRLPSSWVFTVLFQGRFSR